jgi:hypothetical protein
VAGVPKRYEYPRWEFVNRSEDILGLCAAALDQAGIAWRRSRETCVPSRGATTYVVWTT